MSSYQSLLNYTRDIAANLSSENLFFHARKEVLHQIHNEDIAENDTVVWSLPFITSGDFTELGYQFNRSFTVNIIIYQKDEMGSEVDQNNMDQTAEEIQVLQSTDALAEEFIRNFNENKINEELHRVSDQLEITSVTTDNVIKDNDWLLTGTFISITVGVPDEFDYCSLPDVDPITTLSVSNTPQDVVPGNPIVPIEILTDNPATFIIDTLPSGLTFEQTGENSGEITGTAPNDSVDFVVIAIGNGGGTLGKCVILNTTSLIPVTDVSYDNNNQTIWASSGVGSFVSMTASTVPAEATGSYSGTPPSGVSLNSSTGEITLTDFSLLPDGDNDFLVTFTGSGAYSGTPSVLVEITKGVLWKPEDITAGQVTLSGWYDSTTIEAEYLTTDINGRVQQWDDRSGAGVTLTQNNLDQRPLAITDMTNEQRAVAFSDDNLNNSSYVTSTDYWIFITFDAGVPSNFEYLFRSTGNDNRVAMVRGDDILLRFGGVNSQNTILDPEKFYRNRFNLIAVRINGTNAELYINGSLEISGITVGAASNLDGQFIFCGFQVSTNALSLGGFMTEFFVSENSGTGLTVADRQRIEGYMLWRIGRQDNLPAGHPYENLPPFV